MRRVHRRQDPAARGRGKEGGSFEYFPSKAAIGVANLYESVERMAGVEPPLCDVAWGTGGGTSNSTVGLLGNI
jgi:5,10-methylenetetrahydrofolate reductase